VADFAAEAFLIKTLIETLRSVIIFILILELFGGSL
jgi:hypothetical protein